VIALGLIDHAGRTARTDHLDSFIGGGIAPGSGVR
jgi:hypothetical protein